MRDIKALLLCGGKGERLRPMTEKIPKPLVKIRERPILDYMLQHFQAQGIDKFVIAAGYKSEVIKTYVEKNLKHLEVEVIDNGDVSIIERIKRGMQLIKGDFILAYGDTLADVDIQELRKFHYSNPEQLTITSYQLRIPFGLMRTSKIGEVLSFREKPLLEEVMNIGYYYFSKNHFESILEHNDLVEYLQDKIRKNELKSFLHQGSHITVNTIKELDEAEKNIEYFIKRIEAY